MSLLSELDEIDRMKDESKITQEEHDILSAKIEKKYRKNDKALKIGVVALVLALMAIGLAPDMSTNTLGLQIVVNNTNLAPSVVGHPPGTGERVVGDLYYTNDSDIEIFVFLHADTAGQTALMNLSINGTIIETTGLRPLAAPENTYTYISSIIPRYSNYSVTAANYHHYEWREYQILSGNVTTNGTSGVSNHSLLSNLQGGWPANDEFYHLNKSHYDAIEGLPACGGVAGYYYVLGFPVNTFNCQAIPFDNLSWQTEKVNKSGDNMTGSLDMGKNDVTNISVVNITRGLTNQVYSDGNEVLNMQRNSYNVLRQLTVNDSFSVTNYFGGFKARGTEGSLTAVQTGDVLYSIFSVGYNGATWGVGSPNIRFRAAGNYNTTYAPTYLSFTTTNATGAGFENFIMDENSNFKLTTVGGGLRVAEGTNAKQGTCTMVAGVCLVSNTAITSNSRLFYNYQAPCTASIGNLYEVGRNASVNFTIRNTNPANTCTIAYEIFEPS